MAGEKIAGATRERLESVGREVVRASGADEREAEAAARSPFLYARVRASIEAERRRREQGEGWFGLLTVAWRAVPALSLVAILALALFLSAGSGDMASAAGFAEEALLSERGGDIEQVVFTETRAPSRDEVLGTIIGAEEREGAR